MNGEKLYSIFKKLSPYELSGFNEFVQSPFFNKHAPTINVVELIVKAIRNKAFDDLNEHKLFHKLFPKEAFNTQKLNDLYSAVNKLMDVYLSFLQFQKNATQNSIGLIQQYLDRDLTTHYKTEISRLKKRKTEIHASEEYYNNYLIENSADQFFIRQRTRKADQSLQLKANNIDLFFLSIKLKLFCEMLNRANVIDTKYDLKFQQEIIQYIKTNIAFFEHEPIIYVYYLIYNTLVDGSNEEHYFLLKKTLNKTVQLFDKTEAKSLFDYAENYCIKKINSGKSDYLKELLSIYKMLIEKQLLYTGDYLSPLDYKNIVTLGLRNHEVKWTKQFIEHYKNKIEPEFAENAYTYNLANFYYETKEYKQAAKLLQQVEFTDISYTAGAKFILLKIYFEQNEVDALYSVIDSFRVYLVRNKLISRYQRDAYIHFLVLTKQIFSAKEKILENKRIKKEAVILKINQKIAAVKNVSNLGWIQEKIKELAAL